MPHFNYIISGGGMAGLSLLMRLLAHPQLRQQKILLIDKAAKTQNDRTWCFWEAQDGFFTPLVYRSYQHILFGSERFTQVLNIAPYRYQMLRSIDFYRHAAAQLKAHPQVVHVQEEIRAVESFANQAVVTTDKGQYTADYVFNSIPFAQPSPLQPPADFEAGQHYLLQHFVGWTIETDAPVFDERTATFMDFRVGQERGTCFVYVLPLSPSEALVEYTLFSAEMLAEEAYAEGLRSYIDKHLGLSHYQVKEVEKGVIPMTNAAYPRGEGRVVHLGTAGGDTKGSSGYTFQFVQKRCDALVEALAAGHSPLQAKRLSHQRFDLYDATLLRILAHDQMAGADIFATLFRKNPPQRLLRFLDNESHLLEELQIMNSVPTGVFAKAAIQELYLGMKRLTQG